MSMIHITGSGYTEQNDQDNWAAEYLARNLNLHKELDILDHPDGSVTKAKLSNALQRYIDNTADTADTALDLAGDNEAAINELTSRLTSDEQSAAETKKTADNAEKQSGYALGTSTENNKNIGALSELKTSEKTNLVSAINELKSRDDSLALEHVRICDTINNAQTAADNAQTAAENAQSTADGAQAAVDSLTMRYEVTDSIATSAFNSAQEAKDIAETKINELEGELDDINTKIKTDSINTSAVVTLSKNTESRYTNAEFSAIEIILPESLSDDFISAVSFVCGTSDFNFVIPDTIKCLGKDCPDWIFIPTEVGYVYDLVFDFNGNSVKCYVG